MTSLLIISKSIFIEAAPVGASDPSDIPTSLQDAFLLVSRDNDTSGFAVPSARCVLSNALRSFAGMEELPAMDTTAPREDVVCPPAEAEVAVAQCSSLIPPGMYLPFAVQGFTHEVIGAVAAYLYHFGELTSDMKALVRRPSVLARPFTNATFVSSDAVENELFVSMLSNLPFNLGVANAANFLGIEPLIDLSCLAIAMRFRDKTPHEMKRLFEGVSLPKVS